MESKLSSNEVAEWEYAEGLAACRRIQEKTAARLFGRDPESLILVNTLYEDRPLNHDAWDIDIFFEDRGELVGGLTALEIVLGIDNIIFLHSGRSPATQSAAAVQ